MASTDWNPRNADIDRFTTGDCHIFAKAVHSLTGWPIATFDYEYDPTGSIHAFNIMPDGRLIDVEGVFMPKEFISKWKQWKARSYSVQHWPTMRRSWQGPQFGHYSYRRARVVARRLLEHHGVLEA